MILKSKTWVFWIRLSSYQSAKASKSILLAKVYSNAQRKFNWLWNQFCLSFTLLRFWFPNNKIPLKNKTTWNAYYLGVSMRGRALYCHDTTNKNNHRHHHHHHHHHHHQKSKTSSSKVINRQHEESKIITIRFIYHHPQTSWTIIIKSSKIIPVIIKSQKKTSSKAINHHHQKS